MIARESFRSSNKCTLILLESAVDVDNWAKDTEIMSIYFQAQEIEKGQLLISQKLQSDIRATFHQ